MNTQGLGCIDYLPEWQNSILRWITETVMTKLSEDNVMVTDLFDDFGSILLV
jgi:hypothetical protein